LFAAWHNLTELDEQIKEVQANGSPGSCKHAGRDKTSEESLIRKFPLGSSEPVLRSKSRIRNLTQGREHFWNCWDVLTLARAEDGSVGFG
jgi:hypothetical protein